jgi:ADP-ribose pyrophosphatase YjhB (NUDIX family)
MRVAEVAGSMIVYSTEHGRFNYRVAGLCLHEGHVLLHRALTDDFWVLPGGRVELLEPATESLRREMREELESDVEVGRLVWVIENFYDWRDEPCHEISLCFEVMLPSGSHLLDTNATWRAIDLGVELEFRWFPLAEIEQVRILPDCYRRALVAIPDSPRHIVHVDADASGRGFQARTASAARHRD